MESAFDSLSLPTHASQKITRARTAGDPNFIPAQAVAPAKTNSPKKTIEATYEFARFESDSFRDIDSWSA